MGFMKRLLEESWQKDRKEDRRRFQQWLPKTKEKKDGQVVGSGPAQRTRKSPNVERSGSGQPS